MVNKLEKLLIINNFGKIPERKKIDISKLNYKENKKLEHSIVWPGQYITSGTEEFFPTCFEVGIFKRRYNARIKDPQIIGRERIFYSLGCRCQTKTY